MAKLESSLYNSSMGKSKGRSCKDIVTFGADEKDKQFANRSNEKNKQKTIPKPK